MIIISKIWYQRSRFVAWLCPHALLHALSLFTNSEVRCAHETSLPLSRILKSKETERFSGSTNGPASSVAWRVSKELGKHPAPASQKSVTQKQVCPSELNFENDLAFLSNHLHSPRLNLISSQPNHRFELLQEKQRAAHINKVGYLQQNIHWTSWSQSRQQVKKGYYAFFQFPSSSVPILSRLKSYCASPAMNASMSL